MDVDVDKVPFKWFVLSVARLILKCWPLVGKLVFTSNKATVLLPTIGCMYLLIYMTDI